MAKKSKYISLLMELNTIQFKYFRYNKGIKEFLCLPDIFQLISDKSHLCIKVIHITRAYFHTYYVSMKE